MSKSGDKIIRGAREALSYAKGESTASRVHKVAVPDQSDALHRSETKGRRVSLRRV